MTLTKAQRHKIYKECLKSFKEEPDYLCVLIKYYFRLLINKMVWLDEEEVVSIFTEFGKRRPKGKTIIWWRLDPKSTKGKKLRQRILNACIRETTPKKRKPK